MRCCSFSVRMATHRAHHRHGIPPLVSWIWAPILLLRGLDARITQTGRTCIFPHLQYYTQYHTALLLFMSSIASLDSSSHDAGPTTFSQALPEMSGNSVSPIRANSPADCVPKALVPQDGAFNQ